MSMMVMRHTYVIELCIKVGWRNNPTALHVSGISRPSSGAYENCTCSLKWWHAVVGQSHIVMVSLDY